jgi:hypothetical protein
VRRRVLLLTTMAQRLAFVLCVVLHANAAKADKRTDAEELFRRAKALMNENRHRDACPLFEESERLDPQMGTLLNLAICHETVGKIASAWGEFRAVEQMAKQANREDRMKLAHERAEKLEPRLPRIKVLVPADAKVQGLTIKVDGEVKGEPLWTGVAVDPGTRTVEASAPGKKTATLKVKVDDEGALVPITIPKLDDAPKPPPGGASSSSAQTGPTDDELSSNRSKKTMGFVVGGLGLAAMATGGVFGVLAIMRDGEAHDQCPKPCFVGSKEAQAADTTTDRALLFANVSNVVIPLGAIALIIGGYLVLSAGPTERASTNTTTTPATATKSTRASVLRVKPSLSGVAVQW